MARNFWATVDDYRYGDGPMIRRKMSEHVRRYLITLGEWLNIHTPHWHGNAVLVRSHRSDGVGNEPGMRVTAGMWPDDPGDWLFHCRISDPAQRGMSALYQVRP